MNFRNLVLLLTAFLTASIFTGAARATQASVESNVITSREFPIGKLVVDPAFSYVGTTEFVLYGVASCEIHVFAELDGKRVKRFYWVQFEAYLPDNKHTYDYSKDPERATIGGHAFHERPWFVNVEQSRARERPNSDSAAVRKMLEGKGYIVGPELMNIRLVRLDESARRELMVIYSENLEAQGLKADDVNEGGKAVAQREALIDGLRQRAAAGLKMDMK
jgi:hypothetical protein